MTQKYNCAKIQNIAKSEIFLPQPTSTPFNLFRLVIKEKGARTMKNNMRVLLAKRREKVSHVAEATGISKSTLTALYYERTKNPDIATLQKVANYLGVTIDELLTPEE